MRIKYASDPKQPHVHAGLSIDDEYAGDSDLPPELQKNTINSRVLHYSLKLRRLVKGILAEDPRKVPQY